jgi:hypothetical protein
VPLPGLTCRNNIAYVTDDITTTIWRSPVEAIGQLSRICAEFPAYLIVVETTADDRTRFVARSRDADTHPRMVITPDVAELRAALSKDRSPGSRS